MIKRIIYIILLIPGMLIIILTGIAGRLVGGVEDNESLGAIIKYILEKDGVKGVDFEVGTIIILHKIDEYSHFLITAGAMWIVIFLFLIANSGRRKVEKEV